ncbi:hypothetical protein SAICODRAFT_29823 [Saitoella complicata NRRL Y-17804]|uniref:RING-type domain-containing protein n=1 Tax=Saitoella complicata (strain BCRC 22490 / CBS 7301 / JCM 7358 / NBRC 10748 / NRRL Y-17804) TaxID=698492 RepID=A0A0E9NC32_SAICN|nr:uncharacterized protein SAICODRAFT_29823 [Saitoella complicata NRRL Y-17804]ODQ53835.1 hypothetical protein SAICODRAFT_29823 [Saitoella complicata NRRL Y-17804]GAO46960.1 hypothetical protein G7K_1177-t1 [Saitoella complicata NRRL Y-17804]
MSNAEEHAHRLNDQSDPTEIYTLFSCSICSQRLGDPVTCAGCGETRCRACFALSTSPTPPQRPEGEAAPRRDDEHTQPDSEATDPPVHAEGVRIPCCCSAPQFKRAKQDVTIHNLLTAIIRSNPCAISGGTGTLMRDAPSIPISSLRPLLKPNLDCSVCYDIFCDPTTTPCGHSFCRVCLLRSMDYSTSCPTCRASLPSHRDPLAKNRMLAKAIMTLFPTQARERCEDVRAGLEMPANILNGNDQQSELTIPLFVCAVGLPEMPTFLHVFEPRYRLMLRRCLESDRRFGIVLPYRRVAWASDDPPVNAYGRLPCMTKGTVLEIRGVEYLPDGRMLVESLGVDRFTIRDWAWHDDYLIGRIRTFTDLVAAEQARLELEDIAVNVASGLLPGADSDNSTASTSIAALPTHALISLAARFVSQVHNASAPWLSSSVVTAYGPAPLEDASKFSWWCGAVWPVDEWEKWRLLDETSVRGRMKIVVGWMEAMEGSRWWGGGCHIS